MLDFYFWCMNVLTNYLILRYAPIYTPKFLGYMLVGDNIDKGVHESWWISIVGSPSFPLLHDPESNRLCRLS